MTIKYEFKAYHPENWHTKAYALYNICCKISHDIKTLLFI